MKKLIVTLLLLASCNGGSPPPPPPPDTTTTIVEPPYLPPRIEFPFTWHLARGFSLFSGTSAEGPEIIELFDEVHAEWTNLWPTARVCAERERWPDNHEYLFKGPPAAPYDQTSEAFKDTKRFLDWAAGALHAQVLLVPVCTLKEDWSREDLQSGLAFDVNEKWVRHICRLASNYENVAIEVINEWRHPRSIYTEYGETNRQDQVIRMIRACREETQSGHAVQIGTDTNVNRNRMDYDGELAQWVDFKSFHPWRNPDPDEDEMRIMVRQCIGCAVFSETTCWDKFDTRANPTGNCTGKKDQILAYQRDAERKGGVFFYHTKYLGLCWPRSDCSEAAWITPRGDHPIRHGR